MIKTTIVKYFYLNLLNAIKRPTAVIVIIAIFYILIMNVIDHSYKIILPIVLFLSVLKSFYIIKTVLNNLQKLVKICYSVHQLLSVFGSLIVLTIISFATDYTCIYHADEESFIGFQSSSSYLESLGDFIYFSVITFSTVGYGEMIPATGLAKTIVLQEIMLSFLILFFALANINKMHINER